jgi:hypothetical protein
MTARVNLHSAAQREIHGGLPRTPIVLVERAGRRTAGVDDEYVHMAEPLERGAGDLFDACRRRNVRRDRDGVGTCLLRDVASRSLERSLTARAHGQRRALGSQLARGGESKSFARCRDERDFAAQSQIHGLFP